MKYPRGTILKWTKKALSPKREGASQRASDDRMVVLSHDEVIWYRDGIVNQLDMYKTQDSYVEPALGEAMPKGLPVDAEEVRRCNGDILVSEFGFRKVGRR
jgi:hypothetical protein